MPDRASVFERPYLSVETDPGVPTGTGYKQLLSFSISPSIKTNVDIFRPEGYKFATVSAQGKEWTEAKISGQPTYTEIIYALSSVMGAATITTVGSSTKVWTFDIGTGSADDPQTFTVEQGASNVRVGCYSYGIMTDFGMKFDRAKIALDGTMMAQRYRDDKTRWLSTTGTPTGGTFTLTYAGQTTSSIAYNASAATIQAALIALSNIAAGEVICYGGALPAGVLIVFTGTLDDAELGAFTSTDSLTGGTAPATVIGRFAPSTTALAQVPILPIHTSIKTASAQSGLAGASAMTRVIEASFNIGNRFAPIWPLNAALDSWDAHVEVAPKSEAKFKIAADSTGMAFLLNIRSGATIFLEIGCVGGATETGQTYLFKMQCGLKINSISDFSDADGLYAVEFGGEMAYDSTWGHAVVCTVQNLLTAL